MSVELYTMFVLYDRVLYSIKIKTGMIAKSSDDILSRECTATSTSSSTLLALLVTKYVTIITRFNTNSFVSFKIITIILPQ